MGMKKLEKQMPRKIPIKSTENLEGARRRISQRMFEAEYKERIFVPIIVLVKISTQDLRNFF